MKTKIRSLKIKGIRGIRESISLNLNNRSVLIYGDNGTGKSSLADAFEWLYYDQVQHLSNEEIGRKKGKDALRNTFLDDTEESSIEIGYSDKKTDYTKTIDHDLSVHSSGESNIYDEYFKKSQSENLVLRYRDLVSFIIAGKKDKLDTLQDIIGFSEVGNLRDLLKKNANRIKRTINNENFNNKKGAQQSIILQNLRSNAYTPAQFFKAANELIAPLTLKIKINSFEDIKDVLQLIKTNDDQKIIEEISLQTKIIEALSETEGNIAKLLNDYTTYFNAYIEIRKDPEKFSKLKLLHLLNEGLTVLEDDVMKEDFCPLCLQKKNKLKLIEELNERIGELEDLRNEKAALEEQNEGLKEFLRSNEVTIDNLLKDNYFKANEHIESVKKIQEIKSIFNVVLTELKKELLTKEQILDPGKISFDKKGAAAIISAAKKRAKELTEGQKKDIKFPIYSNLLQADLAYKEYRKIERHEDILTKQQITFENLFTDFIRRQEDALNIFLNIFSKDINDYYTSMNPDEKVGEIKLVPLKDKNDDLVGITIEYVFFEEVRTQPIALLSESHINCLGLSFFLASVKAFNRENHFFVLDDVISSFDRSHRGRFAKLLADAFSDYQIILLTHEKDFFEGISGELKSKGWETRQISWTAEKGTNLEEAALTA